MLSNPKHHPPPENGPGTPGWSLTASMGSAARSAWQVPLLCARILVVSSKPLQNAQREFGWRFICVYQTPNNGPCVTSVAKNKIRATMRMVMAMRILDQPVPKPRVNPHMAMAMAMIKKTRKKGFWRELRHKSGCCCCGWDVCSMSVLCEPTDALCIKTSKMSSYMPG